MDIKQVISTINLMQSDGIINCYAIGGAVGATFYLEPVATLDIDIFVFFEDNPNKILISLQPIIDYLLARGCYMEGEYVIIADTHVQFLPQTSKLVEEALREAVTIDVDDVPAQVFTAEHIAAIALDTGRAKDKARLAQFIESDALDMKRFEEIATRHGLLDRWRRFEETILGDQP